MRSNNYAYVNGRFVPENEATVSIFDRGFLYGDGCFETMRVYGGKIFRLREHLRRLLDGLLVLRMDFVAEKEIEPILIELLGRNQIKDGVARVYVTSGLPDRERAATSIVATAQRLPSQPIALGAMTSTIRLDEASVFTGLKTANRLPYIVARAQAVQAGYNDALLLNEHSHVVEFSISNIFVVKNGALWTPQLIDGALRGITREVVLVLSAQLGIACYELSFGLDGFADADEVFASNSIMEIVPVVRLDERTFSQTKITKRLAEAYRKFVQEELSTPGP